MEIERLDCGWCGSARSIEYGICQVCLMEYSTETRVIRLPLDRPDTRTRTRTVVLDAKEELGVAEKR